MNKNIGVKKTFRNAYEGTCVLSGDLDHFSHKTLRVYNKEVILYIYIYIYICIYIRIHAVEILVRQKKRDSHLVLSQNLIIQLFFTCAYILRH